MYIFGYQKAFIRTFHTSSLTLIIHSTKTQFKRGFCTQKPVLNVRFKYFWYTKINPTQIWYDKLISIKG